MSRRAAARQHAERVPLARRRRRIALPAFRRPAARYLGHVVPPHQHPLRRADRGARASCARRVGEAVAGRPSLAFVAGESGVGKTRLLAELERAARAGRRARDRRRLRRAGGGRAALRADRRRAAPAGPRRRPGVRRALGRLARARSRRSSPGSAASERSDDEATAQARLFDAPARAAGAAGRRRRPAADDRGPALGRPLDARVPRLPRELAVPRARAGGHHLPPGRAAPPPPAAPAAGRARARRPRPPRRAAAADARASWPSSSPTSSAPRPARTC